MAAEYRSFGRRDHRRDPAVGAGTMHERNERMPATCRPAKVSTVYRYHTVQKVSDVNRYRNVTRTSYRDITRTTYNDVQRIKYKDLTRTHYVRHINRIVNITRVQPVIRVHTVSLFTTESSRVCILV
jgi:hypothetical protein